MNRLLAMVCVVVAISLGGCGKEPAPETKAPPAAASETVAAENAAPATAENTGSDATRPQQTPAQETAAAPVETVTETEDRGASEGAATQVQPSLRLGGSPATPKSSRFVAGTHYKVLVPAQPTNAAPGKVEVVEVFWYGCGHCFELDPAIESWRVKGKAPYVQFVRIPAMWNESTRMHARVFYTAEVLGKLDELHALIFREIHRNNDPLNTVASISAFFQKHGVSAADFQKTFSSFAVETKLQRAEFLNQRYRVEAVPMVVVNGKYTTGVSEAGNERNLFAVIDELVTHEHGG